MTNSRIKEKQSKTAIEVIDITKQNFRDYTSLNIVAFSCSSYGAMGDGGAVGMVTSDGRVYYASPTDGDLSEEEILQVCPLIEGISNESLKGWQEFYLGGGNNLFVKEDIAPQLLAIVEREGLEDSTDLYGIWAGYVLEILKEHPEYQLQNDETLKSVEG